MFKCKFEVVYNNYKRIRTTTVNGECANLPMIGAQFVMYSKGLRYGVRRVSTSVLVKIKVFENTYLVKTSSGSIYRITKE